MKVSISDYPKAPKKNGRKIKVSVSTHDTWSMDYTLALVILPALKKYKQLAAKRVTWGCMCGPDDYLLKGRALTVANKQAKKRMVETLDKMIRSFQLIANDCAIFDDSDEIQEGLDLFAKYFRALWW